MIRTIKDMEVYTIARNGVILISINTELLFKNYYHWW